jgi:hypothetical protein
MERLIYGNGTEEKRKFRFFKVNRSALYARGAETKPWHTERRIMNEKFDFIYGASL